MNIINGIKIKTNSSVVNETYGLYGVANDYSEFRFSECAVSGLAQSWKDGFITKKGINLGTRKFDLLESGNTMQSSNITIRIKNTSQLIFFIDSNTISLNKCELTIYEFVGTDASAGSVTTRTYTTRIIEDVKFTETEIILTCKQNLSQSRNTVLSQKLDNVNYPYVPETNKDKYIPVIFGVSDPENGRYFKILQNISKEIKYYSEDWFVDAAPPNIDYYRQLHCASIGAYKYPQTQIETISNNVFLLGGEVYNGSSGFEIVLRESSWFVNKYLKCINGKDKNQNVIRKILSCTQSSYQLDAVLQDYMEDLAVGNSTFDATDQTYFEMYDLQIKYLLSLYAILGFYLSSDGTTQLQDQPEIFGKINNEIEPIMSSSVDINLIGNDLDLNPRIYKGDKLTSLYNFSFFKPISCTPMNSTDYFRLNGSPTINVKIDGTSPTEYVDCLFSTDINASATVQATQTSLSNITNRDAGTFSYYRWYLPSYASDFIWSLSISPPELPDNFKFTKCFLGVKSSCSVSGLTFKINYKKNMQPVKTVYSSSVSGVLGYSVDNIPDFYYLTNKPNTGNKNFFWDFVDGSNINGYSKFNLEITNAEEFNTLKNIGLYFSAGSASIVDFIVDINEIVFIFQHEQDISNEFYV